MNRQTNHNRSVLMNISSMLIFGTIGIFRRYIPISSAFLTFSRGILGGLFLLVVTGLKKQKTRTMPDKCTIVLFAVSGVLIGINWILLFEAYQFTTVAKATLCYYMQPTIVILLSPLVFREKLTVKKLICAAAAILGMILVSGVIGEDRSQLTDLKGVLLGLGAAVLYASVVIMNKKIPKADVYPRTTIQLLSAGIIMIPYLIVTNGFGTGRLSVNTILLVLLVGILHTGIAYTLYFASIEGLSIQSVAIFSYIDPVFALFLSGILLKEPLTLFGIIGAVLIIGSALVSEHKDDSIPKQKENL